MKKEILLIAVILLNIAVFFPSCEKDTDKIITMKVEPKIVTKDTPVKLIIENHTHKKFSYGKIFYLEYFDNENWINVQLQDLVDENWINTLPCFNFTKELLTLSPKEKKECLFNTAYLDNLGRYRIVKNFKHNRKEYTVYAEFEIK